MIRFLALVAPLFFLVSCIEGEEELTVNLDASGLFKARYEFPAAVSARMGPPARYRRELQRIDAEEEGIEITQMEIGFVRGKLIFHLEAKFDNVLDLLQVAERQRDKFSEGTGMKASELEVFLGGIAFKLDGLNAEYFRSMDLGPMFPATLKKNPALLMDSEFRFKINLPVAVESSNADQVSADGKSMTWSFMLQDYVNKPIEMNFRTQEVVPWWAGVLGVIVLLLVIWLLWRLIRKVF